MVGWMDAGDALALLWFIAAWAGYTVYADHGPAKTRSIAAAMNARRLAWMTEASRRDVRIVDTQILGNLLTGIGFFASTTIFVIGGLIAMLGVAEEGALALARLPLAVDADPAVWEGKVILLLVIFIYAFFKFAWAFRLANYCSITVGSLPAQIGERPEETSRITAAAAALSRISGHHFNRGLRAYFFALAALGWMLGPAVFASMTAGVVIVLYRREFRSRALEAVRRL